MSDSLFIGPAAKLLRAAKFIDELERLLTDFNNDSPFSARFDFATDPPQIVVDWKGIGHEAMAVLGDAVHNLRAALDLLASELARINGRSDRNVYFPFAATMAEFSVAVARRNFDRAGQDAVTLLHEFAPYRGGNELLRAIHDLDIEDKHTSLLETQKTMDFEVVGSYDLVNPQESEISYQVRSIQHCFAEGSPRQGKPVIESLRELHHEVERVVEAFRALVLRREVRQATFSGGAKSAA